MRHHDHRAWVHRERCLKVLDQIERDVVGRLVEDEEVCGPGYQAGDLQPPLLSRGQGDDRDVQILLAEQAQSQELFGVLVRPSGPPGRERGEQREPRGVRGQLLRKVADPGGAACRARVGLQFARQDTQERRLARAVLTRDQQPLSGRDRKEPVQTQPLADPYAVELGEWGPGRGRLPPTAPS